MVVKVRPLDPALEGCHAVHRRLWQQGFPCPEPLTPPLPFADHLVASAEVHLPGGAPGRGNDPTLVERSARELRRMLDLAPEVTDVPSLEPPRPWAGWSNPRADPWPPPDEGQPLNDHPATERYRALAHALNERLRATTLPPVVGHVDWYQGNLRWREDGTLLSADDWDSISALPEVALVGCAAVSVRPGIPGVDPDNWPGTEVADTEEFLAHCGVALDDELAWAAGLWQRVFDAAKFSVAGRPQAAEAQVRDAAERAARAGVPRLA